MREVSPLVHVRELFWVDGALTETLEGEDRDIYCRFRQVEYYREREGKT